MAPLPPTIPSLSDRCVSMVRLPNCGLPDNSAAQAIKLEVDLWARIAFNPTFALLKLPARYRALNSHPFDEMPFDAARLNVQGTSGTIATLASGVYNPIVTFTCPVGYDGVINNTMNKFAPQPGVGPGLQDGSGMITWAIAINNYLAFNYTNLTMQMGDNAELGPVAHSGGIRIKANDTVTMYALVTAAGLAFLDPNGLILGALQGWVYSNR